MWKVKGYEENNHIQCSLCKTPAVYIEPVARQKIELLMKTYPHQEWLAHLVGRKDDKSILVEDLSVPPHDSVGSASAEGRAVEYDPDKGYKFYEPKNCVGFIHSHHGMGAFHSGTDQNYVDKNYPVSITVATRGGEVMYDTISFALTPCGKATTKKTEVKFVMPKPLFNAKSFLKQAKKNIDRCVTVSKKKEKAEGQIPFREEPYIPIKYRTIENNHKEGQRGFTSEDGAALTRRELEEVLKNI